MPAITVLLVYQLVGEVLARGLDLPIPGPVIGMLLLFFTLLIRGRTPVSIQTTANVLLQHLSLLYVPAGVGVMVYFDLIRDEWLALTLTLIVSTIATIATTALIMGLLRHWTNAYRIRRGVQHG